MRYFSTLPTQSFNSTVGSFTICSFFSYYEFNDSLLNKTQTEVDNKTTLTELSHTIYGDNNSLWLFLLANKTTDPFALLEMNPALYKQNNQANITTGIQPFSIPTTNTLVPPGTIIAPSAATSGAPWQYSSIGNWNIDGAFTIVENTDYYAGKMVVKDQKGGNTFISVDASNDSIVLITGAGTTYSTDNAIYQTKNKVATINDIQYITQSGSGKIIPDAGNIPNDEA
jgi:hypothetical protein